MRRLSRRHYWNKAHIGCHRFHGNGIHSRPHRTLMRALHDADVRTSARHLVRRMVVGAWNRMRIIVQDLWCHLLHIDRRPLSCHGTKRAVMSRTGTSACDGRRRFVHSVLGNLEATDRINWRRLHDVSVCVERWTLGTMELVSCCSKRHQIRSSDPGDRRWSDALFNVGTRDQSR
jgi:hypothetical protein